jgi:hypothetical protein
LTLDVCRRFASVFIIIGCGTYGIGLESSHQNFTIGYEDFNHDIKLKFGSNTKFNTMVSIANRANSRRSSPLEKQFTKQNGAKSLYSHRKLNYSAPTLPVLSAAKTLSVDASPFETVYHNAIWLWHHTKQAHYWFQVTFGLYVMDRTEKAIMYTFVLLLFAALACLTCYPMVMIWHALSSSTDTSPSTIHAGSTNISQMASPLSITAPVVRVINTTVAKASASEAGMIVVANIVQRYITIEQCGKLMVNANHEN